MYYHDSSPIKMNRLFLVFTLILLGISDSYGQVRQVNDIPLYEYVPGKLRKGVAVFADTISPDSLRVLFKVRVNLAQPFCPGTKADVKSVDLLKMWAVPIHEMAVKPFTFELSKDDEYRDEVYQDFWDRYKAYIESWYEGLAYEKMYLEDYRDMNFLLFIGVFRLVPEQSSTTE